MNTKPNKTTILCWLLSLGLLLATPLAAAHADRDRQDNRRWQGEENHRDHQRHRDHDRVRRVVVREHSHHPHDYGHIDGWHGNYKGKHHHDLDHRHHSRWKRDRVLAIPHHLRVGAYLELPSGGYAQVVGLGHHLIELDLGGLRLVYHFERD